MQKGTKVYFYPYGTPCESLEYTVKDITQGIFCKIYTIEDNEGNLKEVYEDELGFVE